MKIFCLTYPIWQQGHDLQDSIDRLKTKEVDEMKMLHTNKEMCFTHLRQRGIFRFVHPT